MKKFAEPIKAILIDPDNFRVKRDLITIFGEDQGMYQTDIGLVSKHLLIKPEAQKDVFTQMNKVMDAMKPVKVQNDKLRRLIEKSWIVNTIKEKGL